jgi:hypothetical protein
MECRFVVEAKDFFFSAKSSSSALPLKNEVFLMGGGSGLTMFHLVGVHGEGGTEVARV